MLVHTNNNKTILFIIRNLRFEFFYEKFIKYIYIF